MENGESASFAWTNCLIFNDLFIYLFTYTFNVPECFGCIYVCAFVCQVLMEARERVRLPELVLQTLESCRLGAGN